MPTGLLAARAELVSVAVWSGERQKDRLRLGFCGVELKLVVGLESDGHSNATGAGETCIAFGRLLSAVPVAERETVTV